MALERGCVETAEAVKLAMKAFRDDDAATFRQLLDRYPALRSRINEPAGDFDSPLITRVRSRAMLDALLDAGADINARSNWWAGGFGLLDSADGDLSAYAIERGALVTVHAAARLGMLEKLEEMLHGGPELVRARGGDGQTPLHFASTVAVAELLLERGADIDARDVDHESTPAQYMVRTRPEVARHLIRRGCKTDILLAAALGDPGLVREHLDADPECVGMRVSDEYFPMAGSGKGGGTIYQWELGWYVSACQVARAFGYADIADLLMERSPAGEKLLNACWFHDREMVNSLLAQDPNLAESLRAAGRRHAAHAARNRDTIACRLMLEAGLPVDEYSQHHATALHWAAWQGNVELVRTILAHDPPLEDDSNDYRGTPLDWALHGSENAWPREEGAHAATVEALLEAGAVPPQSLRGAAEVQQVLGRYLPRGSN